LGISRIPRPASTRRNTDVRKKLAAKTVIASNKVDCKTYLFCSTSFSFKLFRKTERNFAHLCTQCGLDQPPLHQARDTTELEAFQLRTNDQLKIHLPCVRDNPVLNQARCSSIKAPATISNCRFTRATAMDRTHRFRPSSRLDSCSTAPYTVNCQVPERACPTMEP
jgi:hypothetical protein